MKKAIATAVLLLFAVVAFSINLGPSYTATPFATGSIGDHSHPGTEIFIGTSAPRLTLAAHTNQLPSADVLPEDAGSAKDSASLRRRFLDDDRPLHLETATYSSLSNHAPPALPALQS